MLKKQQKCSIFAQKSSFFAKNEQNGLFAAEVFEEVSDYILTDCSLETISKLSEKFRKYEFGDIATPKGEYVLGEKFYEFYIDEKDLDEIILKYLYAPK